MDKNALLEILVPVLASLGCALILSNLLFFKVKTLSLYGLLAISLSVLVLSYNLNENFKFDAGLFPLLISAILTVSIMLLITSTKIDANDLRLENSNSKFVLALIGLIGAYLFFIEILGYYIATSFFIFTCASVLKYKNLLTLTSTIICWCLVIFLLFEKVLKINLSTGIIF
ncbi:MAG: tripartite tricarboxylate transporter TctB family protein [Bdellovibrionales bacterium]|nr:tripartite tricarboxylate transporter TctB family protein [Bdellovibrionales bacterium]